MDTDCGRWTAHAFIACLNQHNIKSIVTSTLMVEIFSYWENDCASAWYHQPSASNPSTERFNMAKQSIRPPLHIKSVPVEVNRDRSRHFRSWWDPRSLISVSEPILTRKPPIVSHSGPGQTGVLCAKVPEILWEHMEKAQTRSIQQNWLDFESRMKSMMLDHIPKKKIVCYHLPWLTSTLRCMCRKKGQMYAKAKKDRTRRKEFAKFQKSTIQ